jgi:hypothetical protein
MALTGGKYNVQGSPVTVRENEDPAQTVERDQPTCRTKEMCTDDMAKIPKKVKIITRSIMDMDCFMRLNVDQFLRSATQIMTRVEDQIRNLICANCILSSVSVGSNIKATRAAEALPLYVN